MTTHNNTRILTRISAILIILAYLSCSPAKQVYNPANTASVDSNQAKTLRKPAAVSISNDKIENQPASSN